MLDNVNNSSQASWFLSTKVFLCMHAHMKTHTHTRTQITLCSPTSAVLALVSLQFFFERLNFAKMFFSDNFNVQKLYFLWDAFFQVAQALDNYHFCWLVGKQGMGFDYCLRIKISLDSQKKGKGAERGAGKSLYKHLYSLYNPILFLVLSKIRIFESNVFL